MECLFFNNGILLDEEKNTLSFRLIRTPCCTGQIFFCPKLTCVSQKLSINYNF